MELSPPLSGVHLDVPYMLNKKLISNIVNFDNYYYYTFRYDKDVLCYNDEETRLYRMVIYSYPENCLLSYSPPKALGYNTFTHYYPTITPNIQVSEYVKGSMVTLLYDNRCNIWRIVSSADETKTSIISKLKSVFHINDQHSTPILEYLPKTQCYTFILKRNYRNLPTNIDKFYLVSVYEIKDNTVKYIPNVEYENSSFLRDIEGLIYFPRRYNIYCYNSLCDIPEDIDGFLLTDINTGRSTKMLNPDTLIRETMRAINPYHTYEYFCLRRIDKVYEYNKIYRKSCDSRHKVHNEYEKLITILHEHYMNKFVFKTKPIVPEKYKPYIHFLHNNVYIPSLKKKNKEKITRTCVKTYLSLLNPTELLSLLYQ